MGSYLSFRPGDIVKLKSGERRMMVEEVESDVTVRCKWYDGQKKHVDRFFKDALHHYQMKVSNSEASPSQRRSE